MFSIFLELHGNSVEFKVNTWGTTLKFHKIRNPIKAHFSNLISSYFHKHKASSSVLPQHCVLRNHRKIKNVLIVAREKGNGVFILDLIFYGNTIQKIFPDRPEFKKLIEDPTLKRDA